MTSRSPQLRSTRPSRPLRRLALLAAGVGLCACAPPPYEGALDDTGAATSSPSIELLFPTSSEDLDYCAELIAVVAVDGVELSPDELGGDAIDGQGHWHLLDGGTYVQSTGADWVAVEGELSLNDGRHFFTAELVQNDHQSFEPAITSDLVEFNVLDGDGCIGGTTTGSAGGTTSSAN